MPKNIEYKTRKVISSIIFKPSTNLKSRLFLFSSRARTNLFYLWVRGERKLWPNPWFLCWFQINYHKFFPLRGSRFLHENAPKKSRSSRESMPSKELVKNNICSMRLRWLFLRITYENIRNILSNFFELYIEFELNQAFSTNSNNSALERSANIFWGPLQLWSLSFNGFTLYTIAELHFMHLWGKSGLKRD